MRTVGRYNAIESRCEGTKRRKRMKEKKFLTPTRITDYRSKQSKEDLADETE